MNDFLQKLRNLIKNVKYIATPNVNNPRIITEFFDCNSVPGMLFVPYGMQISLPTNDLNNSTNGINNNLFGFSLSLRGVESNQITQYADIINVDSLQPGEVAFGIPSLTSRLYFKISGDILLKDKSGNSIDLSAMGSTINFVAGTSITVGINPAPLTGFCKIPVCPFSLNPQTTNSMSN